MTVSGISLFWTTFKRYSSAPFESINPYASDFALFLVGSNSETMILAGGGESSYLSDAYERAYILSFSTYSSFRTEGFGNINLFLICHIFSIGSIPTK